MQSDNAGPWAAWIRAWIETDSLWKLTVAVGVHARSLHLLIGWTKKTLDCIRSLILPLSNLIPLPAYNCLFLGPSQNIILPCYTHIYAAQKKKKMKKLIAKYIWKPLYQTRQDLNNCRGHERSDWPITYAKYQHDVFQRKLDKTIEVSSNLQRVSGSARHSAEGMQGTLKCNQTR